MTLSTRLHNEDLAPSETRRWGAYSITAVWFAAVHNIGVYTAAAGFLLLGLPAWQVLIALLVGYLFTYVAAQLTGRAGQRYGIPLPVLARASFGIYGANLPALVRGAAAVAWYGIQTYLASHAVMILLIVIRPQLADAATGGFLGLSPLGWVCFLTLWLLQLLVATHGMELIRRVQNCAGGLVSLVMVALAVGLTMQSGVSVDWGFGGTGLAAGDTLWEMFRVATLMFVTYATMILNFCDFTRFSPTEAAARRGNLFGLPLNGLLFSVTVVVVTIAGFSLFGRLVTEPTELLQASNNRWLIGIGALLFVFATLGVNIIANLVSPAYDFANVFPSRIDFRRGALIACVLSVLVMPWKLYASPIAVNYFLGTLGAFLGPLFGIIVFDYYVTRSQRLVVDDLYSEDPAGAYFYDGGIHRKAVFAFLAGITVSVPMSVVPAFSDWGWLAWYAGTAIAAFVYWRLTVSSALLPARGTLAVSTSES